MRPTGSTASSNTLTPSVTGVVARAFNKTRAGHATRGEGTASIRNRQGRRYDACDCPFCKGALVTAPQCSGRALTDAEKGEPFVYAPLPKENIAVACLRCELVFFPLRESRKAVAAVDPHVRTQGTPSTRA